MTSQELIDVQFDRAVEVVQGLPKTGPIQTDYEEKLLMYSLYKQATVGNVTSPRPGFLDMLGRAKWDAWAKHKDLDPYEAKWRYVEALLKVLRRYSDKTVAMNLVHELESYSGDPENLVASRGFTRSPGSESSGSTASASGQGPYMRPPMSQRFQHRAPFEQEDEEDEGEESNSSEEDDDGEDEAADQPRSLPFVQERAPSLIQRPRSSLSSKYRTPTMDSMPTPPGPAHIIPPTQPLPTFETPSAFAGQPLPSPTSYPTMGSYAANFSTSSHGELSSPNLYSGQNHPPHYPNQMHASRTPLNPMPYGPQRPASRPTLERAIESVQSHLAAVTERLDVLEASAKLTARSTTLSSSNVARNASPNSRHLHPGSQFEWDMDDLGLWSYVLSPLSTSFEKLKLFTLFFARNENRSPATIIIRRLFLDISFFLCAVGLIRVLWSSSGVRRKEVRAALVVLWRALMGIKLEKGAIERKV